MEVVPFAEKIWFRRLSEEDGHKRALATKWEEGVWLGHGRGSNEVWIGAPEGAVKAWSVRRRVMAERWDSEYISLFKSPPPPGQPGSTGTDTGREDHQAEEEPPSEEDMDERPRFLKLRKRDFKKYGYSEDCPGCVRMRRGAKPPVRHIRECRRRVEKSIRKDDFTRWERYSIRRGPEDRACASSEDSTEAEQEGGVEAPSDEYGFPMIGQLEKKLLAADVTDIFSPPRVTVEARQFGLKAEEAWDLTHGWDFNKVEHQEAAKTYQENHKPRVLIGSPPCTPFSQLQTLNPETDRSREKLREGEAHMDFVLDLYRRQVQAGRIFIHEHPSRAKSWGHTGCQRVGQPRGGHSDGGRSVYVWPEHLGRS